VFLAAGLPHAAALQRLHISTPGAAFLLLVTHAAFRLGQSCSPCCCGDCSSALFFVCQQLL
jgi:hypothetical protein